MEPVRFVGCALVRAALVCTFAMPASAVDLSRPDAHAPLGVMGDHIHHKGELMLSYRYMRMDMEGMRDGTESLSAQEVFAEGFGVTPTSMDMQMHMWSAMYAPLEWLTLMAMVPYVELSMDHVTALGGSFTTQSRGLGDIALSGLVRLVETERHSLHAGVGIVTPSGSVRKNDLAFARIPYPMQLGSGSTSLQPTLTWNGQFGGLSFGAQAGGVIRLHENDEGYTLGDRAMLTSWGAWRLIDALSLSLRVAFEHEGNIDGADPLIGGPVPTADPSRQGGERLDLGFGANYYFSDGPLKGIRLALETLVPTWQRLDGPQLETDWSVIAGVQYSF